MALKLLTNRATVTSCHVSNQNEPSQCPTEIRLPALDSNA